MQASEAINSVTIALTRHINLTIAGNHPRHYNLSARMGVWYIILVPFLPKVVLKMVETYRKLRVRGLEFIVSGFLNR